MQESMHAPLTLPRRLGIGAARRKRTEQVKITANMVTILRIVLMPIPGYLLYGGESHLLVALLLIILIGLTDLLDGIMARREGTSVLGGLLDPIADKIFIAVIYLPLTDRGIIPIWLTAAMFARDFAVTALRSTLSLRDAPMRTATLAKYKTAIQMTGSGYIILFLAHKTNPDAALVWAAITAPILLPAGLILYRLIKRKKQGPRSATMLFLTIACLATRRFLGPDITTVSMVYIIGALTIISGFSYFVDGWSAIKGGSLKAEEVFRFAFDGVLVPVMFVFLFKYYQSAFASAAIILVITMELAVGGLGNLLASRKIKVPFRSAAVKSFIQTGAALTAFIAAATPGIPKIVGTVAVACALIVTAAYCALLFIRNKNVYLSAI